MESYPTLKQRLASVLADDSTADVTFLVGDDKVAIGAHSLILAPASGVFKNMLYGSFNRERTVEVPDGTVEGFRALFSYVYTDEAHLTLEGVGSALYLSDKYAVTGLYKSCIEFMKTNVNAKNVCDFLEAAELFKDQKEICASVIRSHSEDVLKSDGFLRLSKASMKRIIASDELRATEIMVYERAVEWAQRLIEGDNREATPRSIREALGNALYHIRFPLMDQKEFAAGPAASRILLDKDCLTLYAWFNLGKEPAKFCCKPRAPSTVSVDEIIESLGLTRTTSPCPHTDEKCLSVKAVVDACNGEGAACGHRSIINGFGSWICLQCLEARCSQSPGVVCSLGMHSRVVHHSLFVAQSHASIFCVPCWTCIARK